MTKKKNHIFLGLANIFLAILVLFSVVAGVANAWSGRVHELLGTEKASIERSLDPEDYRHPSDFSTPAELIAAEIDYGTRLQAEGTVALKGTPAINGTKVTLFGMRSGENMQFGGSMGELISTTSEPGYGAVL